MIMDIVYMFLGAFFSGLVGVVVNIITDCYRRRKDEEEECRKRERNLVLSLAMLTICLKMLKDNYNCVHAFKAETFSEIGKKNNNFLNSVLSAFKLVNKNTRIRLIKIIHNIENLRLKIQFTPPDQRVRYKGDVVKLLGECNDVLRNLEEELKIGIKISNYTVSIS